MPEDEEEGEEDQMNVMEQALASSQAVSTKKEEEPAQEQLPEDQVDTNSMPI